jgi:HSP20 family protein
MGSLDFWGRQYGQPNSLIDEMWNMFNEFDSGPLGGRARPGPAGGQMTPACDLSETTEGYLLTFDLPGLKREDISIDVTGRRLVVSGERRWDDERTEANYFRRERSYGKFSRAFELPEGTNVDAIEAGYENGVLKLAVPKAEESKVRKIQIGEAPRGFLSKLTDRPQIKVASSKN